MIIDLCSDEEENQSETVNRNHKEVVVPLIIDAIEERSLPLPPLEPINQNRSHSHHTALLNLSQDDNDDDLPHDLLFDDNHHSLGIQNKPQKIRKRKVTNEEAKTVRINNKVQLQQRYGYYKYQELSLIIEKSLYDSNLGGELGSYLLFSSENRAYGYDSMTSSISGLCQWTYRNYLDGGNGQLGEVGVVPLPVVMIVYPPQKLISFALQSEDGLTFSEYSQEIQTIRSILSPLYPNQQIKILITLIGIHDECVIYQRTHRNTSNGTTNGTILLAQRIDEILTYSFYIENVEICCRKNSAEFCTYMESLTRVLGEQLYSLEKSSLDTFKRLPIRPIDPTKILSPLQKEEYEMFQIWVNMLQMIPGISKNKAEQLATHYPSPTHLLEFVNDSRLTEEAIINILQEKLSNQEKKIKCKKLSKLLYTIFTTQDSSTSIL